MGDLVTTGALVLGLVTTSMGSLVGISLLSIGVFVVVVFFVVVFVVSADVTSGLGGLVALGLTFGPQFFTLEAKSQTKRRGLNRSPAAQFCLKSLPNMQ